MVRVLFDKEARETDESFVMYKCVNCSPDGSGDTEQNVRYGISCVIMRFSIAEKSFQVPLPICLS